MIDKIRLREEYAKTQEPSSRKLEWTDWVRSEGPSMARTNPAKSRKQSKKTPRTRDAHDPLSPKLEWAEWARAEGLVMTRPKAVKKPAARKKPKQARSKAEQRAETLEQILDAAEYLFSMHGLYGVTLRDVAQQVGVHTSLMHYYFEDKFALFKAVFVRRATTTSDRRMKALDEYEKRAAGKPTVAGALHAFLDTDFDLYMNGGVGWKNYGAFGSQLSNTPEGAAMFDHYFDPVVLRLIGILKKALPGVADEDIFWGYHFVTGSFMHSLARSGRLDRLSDGLCKSGDLGAVKARMADFMAQGFASLRKR